MTELPFEPANLPAAARAMAVEGRARELEEHLAANAAAPDAPADVVVAHAWAFLRNTDTPLYWEDDDFTDRVGSILERLEAHRSMNEATPALFRSLVYAYQNGR